ncbi:E3 ubiquitin/ISG15 ligase TRIM25-like [Brachyistius frenatus]|uniref:E3 ubiquitin/ISG15 ligase TRIM25-like n=1 Tax=Brachyistius frenatus TaxID=100188 RepID=UPI0037E8ABC6
MQCFFLVEMTQQQNLMDKKKLCCSICLDLLTDPVTIPCGLSYCKNCIEVHWNEEDQKEIHSCPQCRQTFTPRPALVKNSMLADLVEELERTGLQAAPADLCYAGPADVACDVCTGRKLKAVKSCLQCLVSYCELHLQPHYESPVFEKHKLVDPCKKPQENICSHHGKIMKIFCRTDQQCICILCAMDEHTDHDTVLASAEQGERQGEIATSRQKIQRRIQNREKEMKELQEEVGVINWSADEAVKNSEKIFTKLLHIIKKRNSDVKQQIRSQQKTEVNRVKELKKKLQQELTELRRKDAELEQLSYTEDHAQFLRKYSSLSYLSQSTDSPVINIRHLLYFDDVTAALSEVKDKLQGILSDVLKNISLTETKACILLPQGEPETRAEQLQYSKQLTLDPNTVNTCLALSEVNRKVTVMSEKQLYSSHKDRFTDMFQVLSEENLSGRHYWEVEKSKYEISIAVAYKDISRTGYESGFGNDNKSWALECFTDTYEFRHNRTSTFISAPRSSRIGVYLDHRAGILSFYSVSDTMTLLHRVQTTFTQPLYQGLGIFGSDGSGAAVELIHVV